MHGLMSRPTRVVAPSRRHFLNLLGLATASAVVSVSPFHRRLAAPPPLFEEIPPETSGIAWVHENAMSANRYLPETMGPGVAFCDFDNDGWGDLFRVKSGASAFYPPAKPLKNALYKNNRDGT